MNEEKKNITKKGNSKYFPSKPRERESINICAYHIRRSHNTENTIRCGTI